LRKLNLRGNELSKNDIESLARFNLEELDISRCKLKPGDIEPLGESELLQNSLRVLNLRGNQPSKSDIESLTRFNLEELDISRCKLKPSDIEPLGESELLQNSLRVLNLSVNYLSKGDVESLNRLNLVGLDVSCCRLNSGDIASLGGSESLRSSLRNLHISLNKIGEGDIISLTRFNLKELDISDCGLKPGDITPLGGNKSLQDSLRMLDLCGNKISRSDVEFLTRFNLEELNVSWCELNPGDITPLGKSESLRSSLRRLYLIWNGLSRSDVEFLNEFNLEDLSY
jgi:hypothetical protein